MSNTKKAVVILAHAFVGWALCAATMAIGMATLPEQTAMIIHAVAAPFIFGAVSLVYFRRFAYTTPWVTAALFVGFVITMDFFVVALLILGSLEMFASPLGTWIPFALIFGSTWLTGSMVGRSVRAATV
jgi:hypothetical protein